MYKTSEYYAWVHMRERCEKPNNPMYRFYGGMGIKVCKRWSKFENFIADMGKKPTKAHILDRIKPDKDYKPSNCRWATFEEQRGNSRRAHWLTMNGETLLLSDWARRYGLKSTTVLERIKHGWTVEQAITIKPGEKPA